MSVRFVFAASSAYTTVLIAERLAGLASIPIITRALAPDDIGGMLLIANLAGIVNLVFGYTLLQALPIIFARARHGEERRSVAATIYVAFALVMLAAYLAIALCATDIAALFNQPGEFAAILRLGAVASFIAGISLGLTALLRSLERHWLFAIVQLPALVVQTFLMLYLLIALKLGLAAIYIAILVCNAATLAIYLGALWYWLSGRVRYPVLHEAVRIGTHILPWQLAVLSTTGTAGFVLTYFDRTQDAGHFSVANSLASVVVVATYAFNNVWTPFLLLRADDVSTRQLAVAVFSLYSTLLLVGCAALALFSREIFSLLMGPAFRDDFRLVPPLLGCYAIFALAYNFAQGIPLRQKTIHYSWIGFLTAGVFTAVAFGFVKAWGAWAVIVAMAAAFSAMLIAVQIVSHKLLAIGYPWLRHSALWVVGSVIVLLSYDLPLSWASLAWKAAAFCTILLLPFALGAISITGLRAMLAPVAASTETRRQP